MVKGEDMAVVAIMSELPSTFCSKLLVESMSFLLRSKLLWVRRREVSRDSKGISVGVLTGLSFCPKESHECPEDIHVFVRSTWRQRVPSMSPSALTRTSSSSTRGPGSLSILSRFTSGRLDIN